MKKNLEAFTLDEIVNLSGEAFAEVCKEATVGVLQSTKVIVECKYTEMEKVKNVLLKEAETIDNKDELSITLNQIIVALQKLEDCATIIVATLEDKTNPRK